MTPLISFELDMHKKPAHFIGLSFVMGVQGWVFGTVLEKICTGKPMWYRLLLNAVVLYINAAVFPDAYIIHSQSSVQGLIFPATLFGTQKWDAEFF